MRTSKAQIATMALGVAGLIGGLAQPAGASGIHVTGGALYGPIPPGPCPVAGDFIEWPPPQGASTTIRELTNANGSINGVTFTGKAVLFASDFNLETGEGTVLDNGYATLTFGSAAVGAMVSSGTLTFQGTIYSFSGMLHTTFDAAGNPTSSTFQANCH